MFGGESSLTFDPVGSAQSIPDMIKNDTLIEVLDEDQLSECLKHINLNLNESLYILNKVQSKYKLPDRFKAVHNIITDFGEDDRIDSKKLVQYMKSLCKCLHLGTLDSIADIFGTSFAKNAQLTADKNQLTAENTRLIAENTRLTAENARLSAEIAKLRRAPAAEPQIQAQIQPPPMQQNQPLQAQRQQQTPTIQTLRQPTPIQKNQPTQTQRQQHTSTTQTRRQPTTVAAAPAQPRPQQTTVSQTRRQPVAQPAPQPQARAQPALRPQPQSPTGNKNIDEIKFTPKVVENFDTINQICERIVAENDREAMLFMVREGFVYTSGRDDRSVFTKAAEDNNQDMLNFMIECGVNVNIKDKYNCTALLRAAKSGHAAVVEILLAAPGINVNLTNNFKDTPLILSSWNGHSRVVKKLLAVPGINVNAKNTYGETALSKAMSKNRTETVRILREHGAVE